MKIVLALLAAVGCASPMAAIKDDNRRLSETVSELRADRRAQERRLRDLQRQLDLARAQLVTSTVDGSMPELRVEVAAPAAAPAPGGAPPVPAGSRVVGVADDGSEIVYEGDAAAGKQATLDDDLPAARAPSPAGSPDARATAARPTPTRPASSTAPAPQAPPRAEPPRVAGRASPAPKRQRDLPSERSGDAGNDYRAAVELVKAGSYADGAAALRAFLAKHPRHDFADNAQYWLGEAYYAQKDYPNALAEFRSVIETYPRGNKVPDALLKVGYCYLALGQADKSRAVLEQVVNLYPKTEPAATAARRLENL